MPRTPPPPRRDPREILAEWPGAVRRAGPLAPAYAALRTLDLPGLLRLRARWHPHRPALRTPTERLSYAQVDRAVDAWAHALRARGVRPGDCVAIRLPNRLESLLLPLALARLGATSALVNPEVTGAALAHALRAARACALILDGAGRDPAAELGEPLRGCCSGARPGPLAWILRPEATSSEATGENPKETAGCETWAWLDPRPGPPLPLRPPPKGLPFTHLFTSGTTGRPKAAPIHRGRLALAALAFQAFALEAGAGEVLFTPLPLFHASAWIVGLLPAWLGGAAFAFAPRFSASAYWDQCEATGATVGLYVGEMIRYLLAAGPRPGDRAAALHTFVGNGLAAGPWRALLEAARDPLGRPPRVVEFYGATEGTALLLNRNGKVGACGRPVLFGPLDGLRLVRYDVATDTHPRDARGRLVPCGPDEPGELIGRLGVLPSERFDGYLDAEATARKILRDGFATGDRWFRTGDLLRCDAEGDFHFVDRIGDTFRWKGENVSTQEVAEVLRGALPEDLDAFGPWVVYGVQVPGQEGRAGMLAAQVGAPLGEAEQAALWRAAQALPAAARPAFVRLAAALDTTHTLKWQRTRLQREGFVDCGPDTVWIRDDGARTYRPLRPEDRARVESGALRL